MEGPEADAASAPPTGQTAIRLLELRLSGYG